MIKVICIAGDGRSGSTLLDSILSNINGSVSVGECCRFWNRWLEGNSFCGCGKRISSCSVWSNISRKLKEQIPDYDHNKFSKALQEIQYFKNFKKIRTLRDSSEGRAFLNIITTYFKIISELTDSKIIIDSSKSVGWAYLLQQIDSIDAQIIHLERHLAEVAHSWKKDIELPEYRDKTVFMPKKSNTLIIKTWLKVKLLSRSLKKEKYIFVKYDNLRNQPEKELSRISEFLGEIIEKPWIFRPNHSIGGNPMRYNTKGEISVQSKTFSLNNLNWLERFVFRGIHFASKII